MKSAKKIDFSELNMCLQYDAKTGDLIWLKNFHKSRIGKVAGHKNKRGYVYVKIGGSLYHAARLAWVLSNGKIDEGMQVDHINRIPSDNRLCNLRLVSESENCLNRGTWLGEPEPRYYTLRKSGAFQVEIRGKYIGCVSTEDAAKALVFKTLEAMP